LLSKVFARAIARRWEKIILKNCDNPYFLFHGTKLFIKLKKNHIASLRDIADFIIISGRRDARDKQKLGIKKL
jgi:DNA ligase 4